MAAGAEEEPPPPLSADPRVEVLLRSIAEGVATKEANAARKAAGKAEPFPDWAAAWFAEHAGHVKQRLPMVDEAVAQAIAAAARDELVEAHAEGRLDARLADWAATRPPAIATLAMAA